MAQDDMIPIAVRDSFTGAETGRSTTDVDLSAAVPHPRSGSERPARPSSRKPRVSAVDRRYFIGARTPGS